MIDPAPEDQAPIVGIAIAKDGDKTFAWYADGTYSKGTTTNLQATTPRTPFEMPGSYGPWNIRAVAIRASDDHVLTFLTDGRFIEGVPDDLGLYETSLVIGTAYKGAFDSEELVGVGIADDDDVYAWYSNGSYTRGTPSNLDAFDPPATYSVTPTHPVGEIIDIAIAPSNDYVYTWYHGVDDGDAHASIVDLVDAQAMDVVRRYRLPSLSVAIGLGDRLVVDKAYGYANIATHDPLQTTTRCRLGSVSKVITALGAMKLHETQSGFDVDSYVYGPLGVFGGAYAGAQDVGTLRQTSVVGKAIAPDDHVFTWYHDWTYVEGTTTDPTAHGGSGAFSLAPGKAVEDVIDMFMSSTGDVWVLYADRTLSFGTPDDPGANYDPTFKASLPAGYGARHIVGLGMSPSDVLYVWYDDGTQSAGDVADFESAIPLRSYAPPPNLATVSIRSIAIAKSDSDVDTWGIDNLVYRGWSQDLGVSVHGTYTVPPVAPWKDWAAWYPTIRVSHLLSHTSGIQGSGDVEGSLATRLARVITEAPIPVSYDLY